MEAEVFLLGQWRNFAEMEENLSLPELEAILDASRKKEHARNRFAAALKGVNIDEDEDSEESTFERVEIRGKARLAGVSADQLEFEELGFGLEPEEEE